MAKKDKNEDEYKDENLDNSKESSDEDFGLPDLDDDADTETTQASEDNIEEEQSTPASEGQSSKEEPTYQEEFEEEKPVSYYVPPKKQSLAPIFITLSIIVILACIAVYFIFIRKPDASKDVSKVPVKDTTTYVIEKPIEVEEPEVTEPKEPEIGEVDILSNRTGRSYVVVGSFFDPDLAKDYAEELAKKGWDTYIIPPFGKSKFNRVAIEATSSFAEANRKASELAGQFKEQPWPLKY